MILIEETIMDEELITDRPHPAVEELTEQEVSIIQVVPLVHHDGREIPLALNKRSQVGLKDPPLAMVVAQVAIVGAVAHVMVDPLIDRVEEASVSKEPISNRHYQFNQQRF